MYSVNVQYFASFMVRSEYKGDAALDHFKHTLVWEMVGEIRFDSEADFKMTLEFHSELQRDERRRRRRRWDWNVNAKLVGVDLRGIRFDSQAEEGKKWGIIPQFCGKY